MSQVIARAGIVTALAALLGTGLTVPSAIAAPPSQPGGLSVQQPDAATAMLSWAPVSGANRYEVLVDDDPTFSSPYGGATPVTTVNTTYVPTSPLSASTNYWRVRAVNAGSERSPWADGNFSTPRISTPQPAAPPDDTVLHQPSDPPLLTWSAAAGAQSYLVEVDGDDSLDTPQYTYTTKSTSLVVPDSLAVGDWYWRVTAVKSGGHASLPSTSRRFVIDPISPPTAVSPLNGAAVQDVVLDWEPEPGAKTYEVQVATDDSFTLGDSLVDSVTGIVGTSYSRPVTYDNASYFWRVRAIDVDGQATAWRTTSVGDQHTFTRNYPFVPQLVYPAEPGVETVGSPSFYQWTPVRHASEYELQVGSDANFSPGTYASCLTAGTTYTSSAFAVDTGTGSALPARINEDCSPQAGNVNYWRVRALDRPFTKPGTLPGVQGTFSPAQAFLFEPLSITGMSPAGGTTVDVPTLHWSPVVGAERFEVKVFKNDGALVKSASTYANSYTPSGTTTLPTSGNPYSWTVRAINGKGASSVTYGNEFNVSGAAFPTTGAPALTPLSPSASTPSIKTVPQLTWEPLDGAAYYRVSIGNAMDSSPQIWFGGSSGDLMEQPVPYPTMTDTSKRLLNPGTYDWQVRGYTAAGVQIGVAGPEGRFTVQPVGGVTGLKVAVDGLEMIAGDGSPCTVSTGVCTVPATPTLKWSPDPGVSFYMVYVSRDPLFTNLLEPDTAIPATANVMYAPTLDNRSHTYDDREAGNAYYWHVRPCRAIGICGPNPVSSDAAQHSFLKRSPAPQGLSPATGSGLQTDTEVTFTWNDYLVDNQAYTWTQTGEKSPQAAQKYRIQIDDDISFGSTLVDERVVDQKTYTSPDKLYKDGTYFWRVQAVDSDENGLAWSATQTFEMSSPTISVISPTGSQTVSDAPTFRWNAQAFASSFDIEVYKEADATHSAANLVFSKYGVKTTAYTHTNPLPALSASDKSYIWRVRRTDAKTNKGSWTADIPFRVTGSAPEITSPAAGGSQPANAPVVTWNAVAGAATYDVVFRASSGSTSYESANTAGLAFAATKRFATGSYEVTVRARDAAGGSIGASSLTFSVDAGLSATVATAILAPSGTGVGQVLTSTPPTWNHPDVATTYQWLRDGAPIGNATGTTYTLTTTDLNKGISLRATGTKANFDNGVSISNVIGATAGGALQPTAQPNITGTVLVGTSVKVEPGTWSQPTPTFTYQWLRSGAPIPASTAQTYMIKPEDAGKELSVTVLAKKTGFNDGATTAASVLVPKMRSTTTSTLSKTRIKKGKTVKVGVKITVPGVTTPSGVVKIQDGVKTLKKFTVDPFRKGAMTVKLSTKKLKPGRHKIKLVYLGNASIETSKAKVIRLIVFR